MSRRLLKGGVSVVLLSFVFACGTAQAPESEPKEEPEGAVESPEPEPAPALSPAERLEEIRGSLTEVTAELNENGEYNCCIQPPCHWCALHEGNCECFSNLQEGQEVCPGCGLGWHNGQGVVEGVEASEVKWNITHEHPAGGHAH